MFPISHLITLAKEKESKVVVIPAAESSSALHAAFLAHDEKLAKSILIGSKNKLIEMILKENYNPQDFEIINEEDHKVAAAKAVEQVRLRRAHIILKGALSTGDLMRAVLHKETGLRKGGLLSDVLVSENPMSQTPKIIGLTDGGVNVAPTFEQKQEMIKNAVHLFHKLGYQSPKVALLCALEQVTESMPHTVEAQKLTEWALEHIKNAEIYGPLALDNALWPEAAQIKGLTHPVAGHADILLMANIEAGNALGKAFTYLARKPVGHVIEGAKAPILIPSRAESAEDKLISIAMGILASCEI